MGEGDGDGTGCDGTGDGDADVMKACGEGAGIVGISFPEAKIFCCSIKSRCRAAWISVSFMLWILFNCGNGLL